MKKNCRPFKKNPLFTLRITDYLLFILERPNFSTIQEIKKENNSDKIGPFPPFSFHFVLEIKLFALKNTSQGCRDALVQGERAFYPGSYYLVIIRK